MNHIDWEDIEALESIANQCIYKGKEVGQARAALKAIYGYDVNYEDERSDDDLDDTYSKRYMPSIKKGNC
ncbi:MAG: hypothetical protein KAZ71_07880 [Bacteroidia bacterium]|jgi:hypothetical protein|nr:hypothetical protein [Bacteroidia bacterium]